MAGRKASTICAFAKQHRLLRKQLLFYDARSKCLLCLSANRSLVIFDNYQEKARNGWVDEILTIHPASTFYSTTRAKDPNSTQNETWSAITYPSDVEDICIEAVEAPDDSLTWWTLTEDDIWRTSLSDISSEVEEMDIEPDIFKDLLQGEASTQSSSMGNVSYPGSRILSGVTGGRSLVVVDCSMIVLIQTECDWLLSFYSIHRNTNHLEVQKQSNVYITNSSILAGLSSAHKQQQYFPVLYVFKSADSRINPHTPNAKTVILSSHLFAHVCGSEACLLGKPVCVVTSYCGKLYGIPLSASHNASIDVLVDITEPVVAIFSLTLKLKSVQGEQRLSVLSTAADPSGCNSPNCMLVIGRYGKVHLLLSIMSQSDPSTSKIIRHEVSITAMVQCADVCGSLLIHSTGQDVYITDMIPLFYKLMQDVDDKDSRISLQNLPQGISNVKKISIELPPSPGSEPSFEPSYIVLTGKGKLLKLVSITRPQVEFSGYGSGGHRIKDALAGIHGVGKLLEEVRSKLSVQDNMLQQLHLASLILSVVRQNSAMDNHPSNLCNVLLCDKNCPVSVSWQLRAMETRSGVMSYVFVLRVVTVEITLGLGWCVLVSLFHEGHQMRRNRAIYSKLAHLSGLAPGHFQDISINLEDLFQEGENLPLAVSAKLLWIPPDDNLRNSDAIHVVVPLPSIVLDALLFLKMPLTGSDYRPPSTPEQILDKIARSRSCYSSIVANKVNKWALDISGSCTATIIVTKEQMKNLNLESDLQLMKWLFKESDQNITGKTTRFISPNSLQVSLSVHSPNSSKYEIKLQAQNMGLLLQMEKSIKNRLKSSKEVTPDITLLDAGAMLGKIQNLLTEVKCLQDNQATESTNELARKVLTLYNKLQAVRI